MLATPATRHCTPCHIAGQETYGTRAIRPRAANRSGEAGSACRYSTRQPPAPHSILQVAASALLRLVSGPGGHRACLQPEPDLPQLDLVAVGHNDRLLNRDLVDAGPVL